MTSRVKEFALNEIDVASIFTDTIHDAYKFVPSVVVAIMVALPSAIAVTRPLLFTVATLVLLEYQFTVLLVVLLG